MIALRHIRAILTQVRERVSAISTRPAFSVGAFEGIPGGNGSVPVRREAGGYPWWGCVRGRGTCGGAMRRIGSGFRRNDFEVARIDPTLRSICRADMIVPVSRRHIQNFYVFTTLEDKNWAMLRGRITSKRGMMCDHSLGTGAQHRTCKREGK